MRIQNGIMRTMTVVRHILELKKNLISLSAPAFCPYN